MESRAPRPARGVRRRDRSLARVLPRARHRAARLRVPGAAQARRRTRRLARGAAASARRAATRWTPRAEALRDSRPAGRARIGRCAPRSAAARGRRRGRHAGDAVRGRSLAVGEPDAAARERSSVLGRARSNRRARMVRELDGSKTLARGSRGRSRTTPSGRPASRSPDRCSRSASSSSATERRRPRSDVPPPADVAGHAHLRTRHHSLPRCRLEHNKRSPSRTWLVLVPTQELGGFESGSWDATKEVATPHWGRHPRRRRIHPRLTRRSPGSVTPHWHPHITESDKGRHPREGEERPQVFQTSSSQVEPIRYPF